MMVSLLVEGRALDGLQGTEKREDSMHSVDRGCMGTRWITKQDRCQSEARGCSGIVTRANLLSMVVFEHFLVALLSLLESYIRSLQRNGTDRMNIRYKRGLPKLAHTTGAR